MRPDFRPAITARESTRPPRLVFTSMTPRFIWAIALRSMRCVVSGTSGQCSVMMSAAPNSSGKSTKRAPSARTRSLGNGSAASRSQPKPRRMPAVVAPMIPVLDHPDRATAQVETQEAVEREVAVAHALVGAVDLAVKS